MGIFGVLLALLALAHAENVDYTGYKVISAVPVTDADLAYLRGLEENDRSLDFWVRPSDIGLAVEVMVKPEQVYYFLKDFTNRGMQYEIIMTDVQEAINWEAEEHEKVVLENKLKGVGFAFNQYHTLSEIYAWYDEVAANNADVSLKTVGQTHEGRDLKFLSIGNSGKPVQFFDCMIHAREWIAGAVCLWFANELITGTSSEAKQLRQNFDFKFIVPANPDGYEYSRTSDRMWRKTRAVNAGSSCRGVDPNRNFDVHHCETGASRDPCSDTYCGPSPFSEPCTAACRDEIMGTSNVVFAYSFHSYSQLLLMPYGYTNSHPADYSDMYHTAGAAASAVGQAHGQTYRYGSITDILYMASGGSIDWYYDVANVVMSFCYECRPRSGGFIIDESQIVPNAEEIWAGLVAASNAYLQSQK